MAYSSSIDIPAFLATYLPLDLKKKNLSEKVIILYKLIHTTPL